MWSSVSSSQRILSLWLERLSTDRIARQRDEASPPLVVFGKRGNLDLLLDIEGRARRLLAIAQGGIEYVDSVGFHDFTTLQSRLLFFV